MYALEWVPAATDELTRIWVEAEPSDRPLLTEAANKIDLVLRSNPTDVGESRPSDRRVYIELPLVVVYKVETVDRIVRVLHVRRYRNRRS